MPRSLRMRARAPSARSFQSRTRAGAIGSNASTNVGTGTQSIHAASPAATVSSLENCDSPENAFIESKAKSAGRSPSNRFSTSSIAAFLKLIDGRRLIAERTSSASRQICKTAATGSAGSRRARSNRPAGIRGRGTSPLARAFTVRSTARFWNGFPSDEFWHNTGTLRTKMERVWWSVGSVSARARTICAASSTSPSRIRFRTEGSDEQ